MERVVNICGEYGDEIDGEHYAGKASNLADEQTEAACDLGSAGKEHELEMQRNPGRHHRQVALGIEPVVGAHQEERERHRHAHAFRPGSEPGQ
jgi:hypothetical protein